MKKSEKYISKGLVAVAAALVLTSCVNVDDFGADNQAPTVGFQTIVKKSDNTPRAAIEGVDYPSGVSFGAIALSVGDGQTWDANHQDANTYVNNEEVKYFASPANGYPAASWHADELLLWPKTGTLTFFAYSPYRDNSNTPLGNVNVNPATGIMTIADWDLQSAKHKNIDLMVADIQKDRTFLNSPSGVPTIFNHTLSRVDVKAGLMSEYNDGVFTYYITLRKVAFKQIFTKGDYESVPNNRWVNLENATTLTLYDCVAEGTGGIVLDISADPVGETIFVLPQVHYEGSEGTEAEIFIEWHDSKDDAIKTFTFNLRQKFADSHWGMGNHYTYYLAWNKGAPSFIEFEKPTISADWANGGTFTLEVE